MPVRAACPNPDCRRSYNLADGLATPTARCPACRAVLTYPDTPAFLNETVAPAEPSPGPDPVPATPTETVPTPQRVGRFVVLGRLGTGAFGTVYKARDPQLERDVALKVPNPGMLDTPKRVERFLREAKAAARLRHPHIVPVFDAGQDGDRYYIASAFVDGQPLSDVIGEGGLEFRRAAELVRLLAEAVGYAHEQGVVHRDIKPHNVMLDAADRPHLMDFGLAVRAGEAEKLTNDGAVLGTPAYMAPEQAAGQKGEASPLSDQYSLGVLLYELLTGRTPFSGPPAAVVYRVIHHDPPAPHTVRPDVPPDLETICLKAMAKRPTDRYPMCKMLADDLRQWWAGEPIAARRQTAVERAAWWVRRNRTVAALMLLTVGSLAAGTVAAAAFGLQARNRARDAEVARDAAERAEAEATAAREAADAYAAKADRLLNDLVGEQGRGKDREQLIGQLQGEWRARQEAADRLQNELAQLRARLGGADGDLPPPRPVSPRLLGELADLRAELARSRRELEKAAARPGPYRPTLYQYAQRLLEDGAPGAADTVAATLARVPAEHRGWEWNYLTHWQRPRNFTGRELRGAGRPVAVQLAPSGDRVFTATVEASDLNATVVVSTAHIGGPSPQVSNARQPGFGAFGGSHQIISNGAGGAGVLHLSTFTNSAGQGRPSLTLRQERAAQKGERRERRSLWVTDPVFSPATQFVAYREVETGVNVQGPKPGIGWQTLWPGQGEREARGGFVEMPPARNPAAISDDGAFLAVDSGAVHALPEGARVTQLPFPLGGETVVFSPRSTWVAATHEFDPTSPVVKVVCAAVRNPAEGTREFVGHTGRVRAIGFSADERRMVSGGEDGTVRVWDTATAECLLTLRAGGTVAQVVLSSDGKRLVALVEEPKDPKVHRVRVWEARTEKKP